MKKTDLIRFRCTPEFKGDVQRHADFEQITVSEYVERALENEMKSAVVQTPQRVEFAAIAAEPEQAAKFRKTFAPKQDGIPASSYAVVGRRDVEDSPANTTTDGDRCPHGRFRWQFCGECS